MTLIDITSAIKSHNAKQVERQTDLAVRRLNVLWAYLKEWWWTVYGKTIWFGTPQGLSYLFGPRARCCEVSRLRVAWCRFRAHPAGVWWYSSGLEPDMHCSRCGDDLG